MIVGGRSLFSATKVRVTTGRGRTLVRSALALLPGVDTLGTSDMG
jgi:hypothetical protein